MSGAGRGTGLPLVYSVPSQPNRVVFDSPALGCSGVRPLMFEEKASELPWKGCVHQASAFCQVSKVRLPGFKSQLFILRAK